MYKHLGEGIEALYPGATSPFADLAEVVDDGSGQVVTKWNHQKLGTMPELAALEAAGVARTQKLEDDVKANTAERTSLRTLIQDETEAAWLARTDAARWKIVLRALKALEKRI